MIRATSSYLTQAILSKTGGPIKQKTARREWHTQKAAPVLNWPYFCTKISIFHFFQRFFYLQNVARSIFCLFSSISANLAEKFQKFEKFLFCDANLHIWLFTTGYCKIFLCFIDFLSHQSYLPPWKRDILLDMPFLNPKAGSRVRYSESFSNSKKDRWDLHVRLARPYA